MPRNQAGVFAVPPGTKGVPNTKIESGKYNALIDDLTQDANTARPITAGGTGANNPDAAAKTLGLVSAKDLSGTGSVGGTANAITLDTARNYDALGATIYLSFKAVADIAGGGTTLALDGLDAKPIRKVVAAGDVDVNAGDILEGGIYTVRYDPDADEGEGAFILLNTSSSDTYLVGDFRDTARVLNSDWLRRNGALYLRADYPELADILPALPDTVEWTSRATGIGGIPAIYDVIPVSGGFLLGNRSSSSDTSIYFSVDAASWGIAASIPGLTVTRLMSGNGVYIAIDINGKASVSNDRVIWSAPYLMVSGSTTGNFGVAFGNGIFVAVGAGGKISTSPDGSVGSWTARASGTTSFLRDVIFDGTKFVAVGDNGVILTSTTGISGWAPVASGTTEDLNGIVFGDNLYVVVGSSGTIRTSPTLSVWTPRASNTSNELNSVTHSSAGFMAVGDGGVSRISTSGITAWASTPTGISANLEVVITDPDQAERYLAFGTSVFIDGIRTLPTQLRVPNDDPTYGWIKAVS